jgi:hypothetical protein
MSVNFLPVARRRSALAGGVRDPSKDTWRLDSHPGLIRRELVPLGQPEDLLTLGGHSSQIVESRFEIEYPVCATGQQALAGESKGGERGTCLIRRCSH